MPPTSMDRVLNYPSLPSLPGVAVQVLELTRKPDTSMQEIAQTVTTDPALVAKVLKTVNSSYYGLAQPCPSIPRAMSMLGMNTVKSIVLGFSLVEFTKGVTGDGQAFDMETYWRRAVYSAAAARSLALKHRMCDPEEAFVGSLIADIGMLASFAALKNEYTNVLVATTDDHEDILAIERQSLGFDHAKVGAALAQKWRLPPQLCECVANHHAPDQAPPNLTNLMRTVHAGNIAAAALSMRQPKAKVGAFIVRCREWFNLDREAAQAILDATTKGASELAKSLELTTGAKPDTAAILAEAQDALVATQVQAQQQAEQLSKQNEELTRKTITDALTGAFNRAHFDATLKECFAHAKSAGEPLAVLFFDGDKFKSVNDTLGHAAGDAVLRELSRRTIELLGKKGTVCRYGGEEFAIILPAQALDKAARIAELLRSVIANTPFDLRPSANVEAHPVTISIGVSAFVPGMKLDDPEAITKAADEGVYAAKKNGRNRVYTCAVGGTPQDPNGAPAEAITLPAKLAGKPAPMDASKPVTTPGASAHKPSAAGASAAKAPAAQNKGGRHLVIVEDDPLAAKLIELLFSKRTEYATSVVGSAETALQMIANPAKPAPVCILCDMNLPGITGINFIKVLRQQHPECKAPVILVSALLDDRIKALAVKGGAAMCVNKADLCTDFDRVMQQVEATIAKSLPAQAA